MTDIVTRFIPEWLLLLLAFLTMVHRWYVSMRWEFNTISRWENVLGAIALGNITIFYAGLTWGWWELLTSIAISRLVWFWLLIVSLYVSHRMAKRHKENGIE